MKRPTAKPTPAKRGRLRKSAAKIAASAAKAKRASRKGPTTRLGRRLTKSLDEVLAHLAGDAELAVKIMRVDENGCHQVFPSPEQVAEINAKMAAAIKTEQQPSAEPSMQAAKTATESAPETLIRPTLSAIANLLDGDIAAISEKLRAEAAILRENARGVADQILANAEAQALALEKLI